MKFKELDALIQKTLDLAEEKAINPAVHSGIQPWSEIITNLKAKGESPESVAKKAYLAAVGKVVAIENDFSRLLKRVAPKDSKIYVDIKQEDSFLDKVLARGKDPSKITDVLRAAITVESEADLEKAVANMEKFASVYEKEFKPKHEDPEYGYHGSHHFLINIDNVLIEVQMMTKRLWAYKGYAHDIYAKWRSVKDFDGRVGNKEKEKDKQLSKNLFIKGNQNYYELEAGDRLKKYKDIKRGKLAQKIKFTN